MNNNYLFNKIEFNYDNSETQVIDGKSKLELTKIDEKIYVKDLSYMNLEKCKEIILLHPSDFLLKKDEVKKEFENTFKIKTYFARRE